MVNTISIKTEKIVARTTVVRDTENAEMLIGTWGTYDVSVTEVI